MKRRDIGLTAVCAYKQNLEEKRVVEFSAQKRKKWTRELFQKQEDNGFFNLLRSENNLLFKNVLRVDASEFHNLLGLLKSHIEKHDTKLRKAIPPAVKLRIFDTGEGFTGLMYLFRTSKASISAIIEKTCNGIFDVLKADYLKVSKVNIIQISI